MMKAHANDLAVPAGELEAVRAPAQVRSHDHDLSVVDTPFASTRVSFQKQRRLLHDPVHPVTIDGRQSLPRQLAVHQCGEAQGDPLRRLS